MTLKEHVYRFLLEKLLSGDIKPGARLAEDDLARQANVSRTPLREAIRKLESCGLVVQIPNRGAFVRDFDNESCRNIFEIRELTEGYAAGRAALLATDDQIAEMEKCCETHRQLYLQARDAGLKNEQHVSGIESFDAEIRFHNLVLEAAKNIQLTAMSENITILCFMASKISLMRCNDRNENRFLRAYTEHACLLEAIKSHSPQKASEIASLHVRRAFRELSGEDTSTLTPQWMLEMIDKIISDLAGKP